MKRVREQLGGCGDPSERQRLLARLLGSVWSKVLQLLQRLDAHHLTIDAPRLSPLGRARHGSEP